MYRRMPSWPPRHLTAPEVAEIRRDLHLAQEELAELLGVARSTVARWEVDGCARAPVLLDALAHLVAAGGAAEAGQLLTAGTLRRPDRWWAWVFSRICQPTSDA